MEKEFVKLNKKTLQAVANYLAERPYKEVAEMLNTIAYELNNQQSIEKPPFESENV